MKCEWWYNLETGAIFKNTNYYHVDIIQPYSTLISYWNFTDALFIFFWLS